MRRMKMLFESENVEFKSVFTADLFKVTSKNSSISSSLLV